MKIVYLHQYYSGLEMHGSTRTYEFARRLVNMGHEVHVVTSWRTKSTNKKWFETFESSITIHWLPIEYSNNLSYPKRIRAFFKFAFYSAFKAASLKGDLIYATSTPLTIAIPGIFASRRNKIPMVFEVRDLWPDLPIAMGALKNPVLKSLARMLEKVAYKNSEVVIALSPGMKEGIVSKGYPSSRVPVIPNSCDMELFNRVDNKDIIEFRENREWLGNRPLIVYTGALGRINGVAHLVDLAEILNQISPDVRILVVGGGHDYEKIFQKASNVGVLNRNFFLEDKIEKNKMPILMGAADIASVLFIDVQEMRHNSANKFFDALAAGKPIYLNFGGWMTDLIHEYKNGIVGWQKSNQDIAFDLVNALNDRDWLTSAGDNSLKLGKMYFDRDTLSIQHEKILTLAQLGKGYLSENIARGEYN